MEATADKERLDRDFTELYRAHLRDVYSYSYYRVGNHHDAEDLTTQCFIQAYRHFERAQRESNGRPLRPWLIRIAHNLAANYYRDRSRRPQTAIDDADTLAATHNPEALLPVILRATAEATVGIVNSEGVEFIFKSTAPSVSRAGIQATVNAVVYFVNSEKTFVRLHEILEHYRSEGRMDLVDKYTDLMSRVVSNTSYSEVVEKIKDSM